MNKAEIETCIRKAFTSDPPPAGDRLVRICGDIDTRQTIRDVFSGRRWWELNPSVVMEHEDAISFLEPDGRRYYLPAYLIATLYADPEWFFTEMVIYHLYLPLNHARGNPVRTKFEQFMDLLSAKEKSAIRKFLEYSIEHHPSDAAEEALRVLWHKF